MDVKLLQLQELPSLKFPRRNEQVYEQKRRRIEELKTQFVRATAVNNFVQLLINGSPPPPPELVEKDRQEAKKQLEIVVAKCSTLENGIATASEVLLDEYHSLIKVQQEAKDLVKEQPGNLITPFNQDQILEEEAALKTELETLEMEIRSAEAGMNTESITLASHRQEHQSLVATIKEHKLRKEAEIDMDLQRRGQLATMSHLFRWKTSVYENLSGLSLTQDPTSKLIEVRLGDGHSSSNATISFEFGEDLQLVSITSPELPFFNSSAEKRLRENAIILNNPKLYLRGVILQAHQEKALTNDFDELKKELQNIPNKKARFVLDKYDARTRTVTGLFCDCSHQATFRIPEQYLASPVELITLEDLTSFKNRDSIKARVKRDLEERNEDKRIHYWVLALNKELCR